ncbi:MAG: SH3 domain-containing protein [Candidatus Aminicenantes bacterium]|nr:SH3 domain-containing protein [Candidatus Aminicenantes bacterium]
MKKPARLTFLIATVLVVFVFLLAETVVVKIKTTSIRRDPKFTSPAVAAIKAGDTMEKLEARDGWVKVRTKAGVVGWLHSTAVETKKLDLLAMDKTMKTQASAGEVALAAKGFNKQVEDKYRAGNAAADFAAVDAMEKVKPSAAEVDAFLKQGKLGEYGGAR